MNNDEHLKCERLNVKSQEYMDVQGKFTDMTGRSAGRIVDVSSIYRNISLNLNVCLVTVLMIFSLISN